MPPSCVVWQKTEVYDSGRLVQKRPQFTEELSHVQSFSLKLAFFKATKSTLTWIYSNHINSDTETRQENDKSWNKKNAKKDLIMLFLSVRGDTCGGCQNSLRASQLCHHSLACASRYLKFCIVLECVFLLVFGSNHFLLCLLPTCKDNIKNKVFEV